MPDFSIIQITACEGDRGRSIFGLGNDMQVYLWKMVVDDPSKSHWEIFVKAPEKEAANF